MPSGAFAMLGGVIEVLRAKSCQDTNPLFYEVIFRKSAAAMRNFQSNGQAGQPNRFRLQLVWS